MKFSSSSDDEYDGYMTYRPLSNLPTPPPSLRSSAAQSPKNPLEDGERLKPRYLGEFYHLVFCFISYITSNSRIPKVLRIFCRLTRRHVSRACHPPRQPHPSRRLSRNALRPPRPSNPQPRQPPPRIHRPRRLRPRRPRQPLRPLLAALVPLNLRSHLPLLLFEQAAHAPEQPARAATPHRLRLPRTHHPRRPHHRR